MTYATNQEEPPLMTQPFQSRITLVNGSPISRSGSPSVVLLPGGPCFSSMTLRDLDPLKDVADLAFVDPAGTGSSQPLSTLSYEVLLADLEQAILALDRDVILVGHSFGGIQAADLALLGHLPVRGLCCIASPLSKQSWDFLGDEHGKRQDDEMKASEKKFEEHPSNATFVEMNSMYGDLYFSQSKIKDGVQWLAQDRISHELFLRCTSGGFKDTEWLERIRNIPLPKLFIAGESDAMFPPNVMENDARAGGFQFEVVPDAGHFVTYEQPVRAATLLRKFLERSKPV